MGHNNIEATSLSEDATRTVLALAAAAVPHGDVLGAPDRCLVHALEEVLASLGPSVTSAYPLLLSAFDAASIAASGRRFAHLPADRRLEVLTRLDVADATHLLVRAVVGPLKMARARDPRLERSLDLARPCLTTLRAEPSRWARQMLDARELPESEEMEVDVVIVGTGAGGAPIAARLASRGHAVLMLEEGGYHDRATLGGDVLAMQHALYRDHGLSVAVGSSLIPIPVGRTVGGTTTINSGTCFRTPDDVLRRWQFEQGLRELGPGSLDPHFERVEQMLGVAPTPDAFLGGVARVIARGCDALGWSHGPLARNAPGCDGQGVCCFGCPTGAKRSTNVSYVPEALEHGAQLIHHARVERVLVEGGRAVGVEAFATSGERTRRLVVRSKTVVLACGTLHTPVLLLRNGLANSSGEVGRNLTVHPCGYAWARFAERIAGHRAVPQGYGVDELVDQGIRFEGGFPPLALAAGTFGALGREWTDLVEHFDRLACFGFMIRDHARGRVSVGAGGGPSIRYSLAPQDVITMVRAQAALARIYLAAGAEVVYPGLSPWRTLRELADVERLERDATDGIRARHLDVSAYHPLGTCRMGADPARSVVSGEHESHDVPGLFVCDGSAVSGPLGVNPQITIMALSERAVPFVEQRIEGRASQAKAKTGAQIAFEETMAGDCRREDTLAPVHVSFTVRARGDARLASVIAQRGTSLSLEGSVTIPGIATSRPCRGSLTMRPLRRRANLTYDLSFESDDGARHTLHGVKHAPLFDPRGMTHLHTEVRREGELCIRGVLEFDLHEMPAWLTSFRVLPRSARREPGRAFTRSA